MEHTLSIIAVIGKNRELGCNNKLIWHIPGDLPRFRQITTGHPIIMGRKTYDSIPIKNKPLDKRTNIVISSQYIHLPPEVILVSSIDEALTKAKQSPGNDEIFIIGGASIYKQTINLVQRLYLTVVHESAEADVYFPEYSDFSSVISSEHQTVNGIHVSYYLLKRENVT